MQTHDIKEVGSAIEFVDSTWGLQVPVIVFGYHCLGRSKSIRSDKRVITHLIVRSSERQDRSRYLSL